MKHDSALSILTTGSNLKEGLSWPHTKECCCYSTWLCLLHHCSIALSPCICGPQVSGSRCKTPMIVYNNTCFRFVPGRSSLYSPSDKAAIMLCHITFFLSVRCLPVLGTTSNAGTAFKAVRVPYPATSNHPHSSWAWFTAPTTTECKP